MKLLNKYLVHIFLLCLFAVSCEKPLDIDPPSEFSGSFLDTQEGMEALLASAWGNFTNLDQGGANRIHMEEMTTDMFFNLGAWFFNNVTNRYQEFNFDPGHIAIIGPFWKDCYRSIRDANILITEIPDHPLLSDELKTQYLGEAKFIRATSYRLLNSWFGGAPLITETTTELFATRASTLEIQDFVISELKAAAPMLPITRPDSEYGRATRGAALGVLAQYQLNTKRWGDAAKTAQDVMNLGVYNLLPIYKDIFSLDNEKNKELIFVFPYIGASTSVGNGIIRNMLPGDYPTDVVNAATQSIIPIPFYNTFDADDVRRELIITEYNSKGGVFVNLLDPNEGPTGDRHNHPRSFKYPIDETAEEPKVGGQDVPLVRYADILLIRAEGLVMSTGSVSQEALDLLNTIRNRAGLSSYTLTDIPDQDTFINKILDERKWEFFNEAKRREDLLRYDRFIQNALDRGKTLAQPKHRLFPIPQPEIDANKNLVQNDGY